LLQDPMVSSTPPSDVDTTESKPSPAAVKVTIKPLATVTEAKAGGAGSSDKNERTIAELAAEADAGADAGSSKKSNQPSKSAEETKPDDKSTTESEETTPADDASSKAEDTAKADTSSKGTNDSTETSPDTTDTATSSDDSTDSTDESKDDTKDDKQTAELEAEAKKLEAINALVESREYILPINAVERHRSKVMTGLGLVLILALGALLADLLLDVGFIRLGGVHSLTHFFNS
jgi:cobalamin biosynthesis protein CobT